MDHTLWPNSYCQAQAHMGGQSLIFVFMLQCTARCICGGGCYGHHDLLIL